MKSMRHGPVRFAVLLGALGLGMACTGPQSWWQQDLQEWEGAPVSELLEAWGSPLRTLTAEDEATVLVFERVRELDLRLEALADPSLRLDPDRPRVSHASPPGSDCLVFFEIEAEHVRATRHEGSACDIVPRDPARRRADPATDRRR